MHKLLEGIGTAKTQALAAPNKMLEYFGKQDVNCNAIAIIEKGMQSMETLIHEITTSNELAAYVQSLDAQIEKLNNLETTIAEYRKYYGADYRKDEFDAQLAGKDVAIANLQALRTATAKNAVSNPQILSIKAITRLQGEGVKETIKQLTREALHPIKNVIEAGSLTYLNKIIEKEYSSLTLAEVAHVLSRFVKGEIKIFGKVTISELSAAFIAYAQEKARYLESLAEEAHISQKDTRSQGEINAAMAESRERIRQAEQSARDVQEAKRNAHKEQLKISYSAEPKQEPRQAYTIDPITNQAVKL